MVSTIDTCNEWYIKVAGITCLLVLNKPLDVFAVELKMFSLIFLFYLETMLSKMLRLKCSLQNTYVIFHC